MSNVIVIPGGRDDCNYGQPPPYHSHNYNLMCDEWDVTLVPANIANSILIKNNKERKYPGLNITNRANFNLWITVANFGGAIAGFPSVQIPPGANIDIPTIGRVYGIWEGTGATLIGDAQIIEFI
jgi:hypothetical protein